MTSDQLSLMVARTGSEHLRWSTSDANPDPDAREQARQWVREAAAMPTWPPVPPQPPAAYPPLVAQAGNALAAAARFVGSGCATVDQAEFDRRRAICEPCPNRDPCQDRCRLCACYLAVKPWSKAETCPDGRW